MNLPKLFIFITLLLFGTIGLISLFRGESNGLPQETVVVETSEPVEIALEQEFRTVGTVTETETANVTMAIQDQKPSDFIAKVDEELPTADRIDRLFRKVDPRLPIVETISYKSRVQWLNGRPAWVSDYASHYKTSRHFIARSLNGKRDYFKQNIGIGDRFNVFRLDKDIEFYLLVDVSRSKMWFYYFDKGTDERVLLKTYDVGLGRIDSSQPSGLLTPLGKYSLGEKVAIYKPKQMGWYNGNKVEMVRVFGTRWIPFEEEIEGCTACAKGFGIHGAPFSENDQSELAEDTHGIGKYESDGCVRLKCDDIEEIFSIVITKPAFILLVKDFYDAKLPGTEINL
jgi:hypothetical protein